MKTLIVSHDAGGAHSLASFVLNNPGEYLFELGGPAIQIINSQILDLRLYEQDDLKDVELVLTGTSSESMLEIESIARARMHGIRTVSLLDHWVNYVERFTRDGSVLLPDEIWVTDEIAHRIASGVFDESIVRKVPDFLLMDIAKSLEKKDGAYSEFGRALFISENISGRNMSTNLPSLPYDEFDCFNHLLGQLPSLFPNIELLNVRLHPSQDAKVYEIFEEMALKKGIATDLSNCVLSEDLREANVVFGISSRAFATSILLGKDSICCIPGGFQTQLPLPNIKYLSEINL